MRLVLVEWLDSHAGRGWQDLDRLERAAEPLYCRSVGWVIRENKDCKVSSTPFRREKRKHHTSGLWGSDNPHSLDREDHDTQVQLSYFLPLPGRGTRSTTLVLGCLWASATDSKCPVRASRPLSEVSGCFLAAMYNHPLSIQIWR